MSPRAPKASRDHPESPQGLLLGHPRRSLLTAPARVKVDMAFGVVLQGPFNGHLRSPKNFQGSSEVLPRSPRGPRSLPKGLQGSPRQPQGSARVQQTPQSPPKGPQSRSGLSSVCTRWAFQRLRGRGEGAGVVRAGLAQTPVGTLLLFLPLLEAKNEMLLPIFV